MNFNRHNIVLFCPLNWGLGHATRIVPLINQCIEEGDEVVIAADGQAYDFLKVEFPDLDIIRFAGLKVKYLPFPFLFLSLLLQMPLFLVSFIYEHYKVKRIVKYTNANIVISDNRYGAYCKGVHSVLLTHQLFIKLPGVLKVFSNVLNWFTRNLIEKFDECWVPDFESIEDSLSGELSHGEKLPDNVKYIGPLSRFSMQNNTSDSVGDFDVVIVISGPEPYRSSIENKLIKKYSSFGNKVLVICGKPLSNVQESEIEGVVKVPHLSSSEMFILLTKADKVVTHSGYSSVMDMYELGVENVEWVPTKGQTEQEYIYEWLTQKKGK